MDAGNPNPFGVIVPYSISHNERVSQKKGRGCLIDIFVVSLFYIIKEKWENQKSSKDC
jgi:hypothetical protein